MNFVMTFQSWITLRARETAALGRELLGGNGILADFLVAKVLLILNTRFIMSSLKFDQ